MIFSFLNKFFDNNEKQIKKLSQTVADINQIEEDYQSLTDEQLKNKTIEFQERLKEGATTDDLLPEAFAVVKNASRRLCGKSWEAGGSNQTWQMIPYDVQLIGGIALHQGKIAEMKTGEGKTLVASLPLYLNALEKKGAHLVTVNDYLARRDAQWIGELYRFLGLSVGIIQSGMNHQDRQDAYNCDITYATNNELGFDYLRDNMVPDLKSCVQRGHHFCIVDEVDSILIDEARTPLIISGPAEDKLEWYQKFATLIPNLQPEKHYVIDEKARSASLTEEGINQMEKWLDVDNLYEENLALAHYLESSLKAYTLYHRDKDYVVKDDQVIIVDQFTGRLMAGRRFSEGLHQAIEAKENVAIKKASQTMATITFQNYFRMYKKLSGMTGTAETEAEEFHQIYNLDVLVIPTNKPITRRDENDLIYKNEAAKFRAIMQEVKEKHEKGQPVLIGTISVETSEKLATLFKKNGIVCQVLNAKQHEREAHIVEEAGLKGAVTIATNMAGRGTDIKLGGPGASKEEKQEILDLGGLAVIGSERHEARRIDNQLRGRSGRQGEPGYSRFYVSLDDDLMRIFGGERIKNLMERLSFDENTPIENSLISKSLESAQTRVEGHNFDIRKHLVKYDDVMNKQREVIYRLRRQILQTATTQDPGDLTNSLPDEDQVSTSDQEKSIPDTKSLQNDFQKQLDKKRFADYLQALTTQPDLAHIIWLTIYQEISDLVELHIQKDAHEDWITKLMDEFKNLLPIEENSLHKLTQEFKKHEDAELIQEKLFDISLQAYRLKEEKLTSPIMRQVEKVVLLRTIDKLWKNHLDVMDDLRTGIGLRGYGQRDPLVEYQSEAFLMFQDLIALLQKNVMRSIYHVGVTINRPDSQKTSPNQVNDMKQQAQKHISNQESQLQATFQQAKQNSQSSSSSTKINPNKKIGRNDPCPCGSGKKYKKCHGR